MGEFTKEEITNILVLIEAGARALSSQNKLDQASAILGAADVLSKKIYTEFEKVKKEE